MLAMLVLPFGTRAGGAGVSAGQDCRSMDAALQRPRPRAWDTFLGKPHKLIEMPGHARERRRASTSTRSASTAIRAACSRSCRWTARRRSASRARSTARSPRAQEYENYHLRFEFKWGEKRWPPREQALRDSGCCYHAVGPHGASYGFWMRSFEFQIQEGDCGDFYSLAGVIVDAEAVREARRSRRPS